MLVLTLSARPPSLHSQPATCMGQIYPVDPDLNLARGSNRSFPPPFAGTFGGKKSFVKISFHPGLAKAAEIHISQLQNLTSGAALKRVGIFNVLPSQLDNTPTSKIKTFF